MPTKRIMCEIVFLHGEAEAEAAGDKLRAAGFELFVSNHPDDFDEGSDNTKFGMVWKDFGANVDANAAKKEFWDAVGKLCPLCTDEVGFVDPNHVPTRFSDYGERSASVDELNRQLCE